MDEARISFLLKASQLLPPKRHITKLLKSYYLTNIKRAAGDELSTSNKSAFGDKTICKRCSAPWCDGDFNLTHKPSTVSSPRARKLVEALNKGEKLSKKQKIRAKWYRKRLKSAVIITCNLCHNKCPLYLEKPGEASKRPEEEEEEVTFQTKPKKKKDKTAGLKIASSRQPVKQKRPQNLVQPTKKDKKIHPSSHNVKKAKETEKSTKVVSKTQKKNTLLQLATMLKASFKPGTTSNDRLKNLLK